MASDLPPSKEDQWGDPDEGRLTLRSVFAFLFPNPLVLFPPLNGIQCGGCMSLLLGAAAGGYLGMSWGWFWSVAGVAVGVICWRLVFFAVVLLALLALAPWVLFSFLVCGLVIRLERALARMAPGQGSNRDAAKPPNSGCPPA